jgi:hypothetical protein
VTFNFEGRKLTGRVNRIAKRATVLVADPDGVSYSDGLRYRTYYVPLACLTFVTAARRGKILNPVRDNRFSGKQSPTGLSNRLWSVCVRMVGHPEVIFKDKMDDPAQGPPSVHTNHFSFLGTTRSDG